MSKRSGVTFPAVPDVTLVALQASANDIVTTAILFGKGSKIRVNQRSHL